MDEEAALQVLRQCWSRESSAQWTPENPARGQCCVTALVIQDLFGGEIQKTMVNGERHFYNRIDGARYDFSAEQFEQLPEYLDLPSSREEALSDTTEEQYVALWRRVVACGLGASEQERR